MMDSCRPRKLDPGLEAQYSMPSDLMTSTMKSAPGRWLEVTSAVALEVSGLRATCCAMAIGGLPTSPAAPAATAAPLKKPRRSTGSFFDMHCLLKAALGLSIHRLHPFDLATRRGRRAPGASPNRRVNEEDSHLQVSAKG